MSPAERIGQLLMVGVPSDGLTPTTRTEITRAHVGNLFLTGRSTAGVRSVRSVTDAATDQVTRSSDGVPPWIAADQEGGAVQSLRGPGFTTLPSALAQGTTSPAALRRSMAEVGRQLHAAGVNLNLAPVLDTVPRSIGTANAPIGAFGRQFGSTPAAVTSHGVAAMKGLLDGGTSTAVKHFPGLGRVRVNTDKGAGAVDKTATRDDPLLAPFRAAVRAGTPAVLVSLARYPKIDPDNLAAFSPVVMRDMLRKDLGFTGVVISDDLGAAVAVSTLSPGERAVRFVAAGGDVALTVQPTDATAMAAAITARMRSDATFSATASGAVRTVLRTKAKNGTLRCS